MVDTNITLTCSATYPDSSFINVATNVSLQWLNSSNHIQKFFSGLNDYTDYILNYTISNVKLSDAGEYYCSLFINTTMHMAHIISSDTKTASTNVVLVSKCLKFIFCNNYNYLVPNEINVAVFINPNQTYYDYYEVGSNITLTCAINYYKPSYFDVNTRVYMQWTKEANLTNITTPLIELTNHNLTYTISSLKLLDAGMYSCTFFIETVDFEPSISRSNVKGSVIGINAISKL